LYTTYILGNQNDKCVMIKNLKLEMKRHKTINQVTFVINHKKPWTNISHICVLEQ